MSSVNSEQELKRKAGISKSLNTGLIEEAQKAVKGLPVAAEYAQFEETLRPGSLVPFEGFELTENARNIIKKVAVTWLESEENVHRVHAQDNQRVQGNHIQRAPRLARFAAIRMKRNDYENQKNIPSTLKGGFTRKAWVTVLIALSDVWDKSNGFFLADISMRMGEDIVLQSNENVRFPGTGGGLAILFYWDCSPLDDAKNPE